MGIKNKNDKVIQARRFIEGASLRHNYKYDYSLVDYKKSSEKVIIICPKHGRFLQRPNDHKRKDGCPKCKFEYIIDLKRKTVEQFIIDANTLHKNFYDYSKVQYKNANIPVEIKCPKHGTFWQRPGMHCMDGRGCPKCAHNCSRAERVIMQHLDDLGYVYEFNKTFEDSKNPVTQQKFRYDFWIPSIKTVVEYDGEQHTKPANIKGRISNFKKQLINYNKILTSDVLKNYYIEQNNLNLIRINHWFRMPIEITRELDRQLALVKSSRELSE